MRTPSLDVRALASLSALARVGVVVPRYGHSAVERNRLKRRLRELIRLELLPCIHAMDVVVRTAPRAYERQFEVLRAEVQKLAYQLSLKTGSTTPANRPSEPPAMPPA